MRLTWLWSLVVDECDDGREVGVGEREWRHAFVGAPAPDDRADRVAANVLGHEQRTCQVSAAFAPAVSRP